MNLHTSLLGLGALLLTAGVAQAQAGASEDFENGNPNNWQIDFNGTFNGFAITATPGVVAPGGNPGNRLEFSALTEQLPGPWFLNSQNNPDFSGNLRAAGVDGISIDMNYTTVNPSPFGNVFCAMIADDMGTADVADDIFAWKFDFAYAFNGFGPVLPQDVWHTLTWDMDTQSSTLPAGWNLADIGNTFTGDVDAAWDALVQDVDYVAFSNGAPWGGNNFGDVDIRFDNILLTTGEIGTAFCFGDGSGIACPCGNNGAPGNGCGNGVNAGGARLSAVGLPSVSNSSVTLTAVDALPGVTGVFFQGNSQVNGGNGQLFSSDGLLCTTGNILRLETVSCDVNGTAVSSIDLGATAGNPSQIYQFWYRDQNSSPCGQLSNTTNALEIVWQP